MTSSTRCTCWSRQPRRSTEQQILGCCCDNDNYDNDDNDDDDDKANNDDNGDNDNDDKDNGDYEIIDNIYKNKDNDAYEYHDDHADIDAEGKLEGSLCSVLGNRPEMALETSSTRLTLVNIHPYDTYRVSSNPCPISCHHLQGVQEKLCFFHNSLQPLPRLHLCKGTSKLSRQCECTVTPIGW